MRLRTNLVALVLLVACSNSAGPSQQPPGPACTREAKICPDGSAVGRTGPNCEFAACPEAAGTVCTMEAKMCPDGSAVGRSGPNCEFAACPNK